MPFQLGLPEMIVVLVVALLFLGPKRLPEAGRSLGRGIREFKDGITDKTPTGDTAPAMLHPALPSYTPPQSYTPPAPVAADSGRPTSA
jgi:sec-independent protein translocase protein TatA